MSHQRTGYAGVGRRRTSTQPHLQILYLQQLPNDSSKASFLEALNPADERGRKSKNAGLLSFPFFHPFILVILPSFEAEGED
jgi:hypothetical protein